MSDRLVVLVVEDSVTQAKQLESNLIDMGFEVLMAYDGIDGLKMATTHIPDVIVLDVKMPGMDGIQVCQRLKRHPDTKDIPVFMMSASTDSEHTMAGLNAGATDYIPKDIFAASHLLHALEDLGLV